MPERPRFDPLPIPGVPSPVQRPAAPHAIRPIAPVQPTPVPSPPAATKSRSGATRYLAAAAYHDGGFRRSVIAQTIEEEFKAVPRCPAVDLPVVVRHCLRADRRAIRRHAVLALLAFVTLVGSAIYPLLAAGALALAFVWILVDLYVVRRQILATQFARESFDPGVPMAAVSPRNEEKLKRLQDRQTANVVVSGAFSPFVGSGFDIGGWSFSLMLDKGKDQHGQILTPQDFNVDQLYAALSSSILALRLDGVQIADRLFADGSEVRRDARFLPDPFGAPVSRVSDAILTSFIDAPTEDVRHYRCIEVTSWQGELVLSVMVRFAKTGRCLFAEASRFLLPPLKPSYHRIDAISKHTTFRQAILLLLEAAVRTPFALLYAPFALLEFLLRPDARWRRRRAQKRQIAEDMSFNYGSTWSVRDLATSGDYRRYFQKLDKEMNLKIVERQVLDAIVDFLDARNIDTSDLRERQTYILNQGVVISGGSIQAGSFAVGNQAMAQVRNLASGVIAAASPARTSQQRGPAVWSK